MAVPYTFGSATSAIPLSQLDSNFATTITLGNTAIQLGNTVTTLNNMTLANVTVQTGNVTIGQANAVVYTNSSNVATANASLIAFDGANLGLGVTPSANSLSVGLDLAGGAGLFGFSNQTELTCNAYYSAGAWRYKANAYANLYQMQSGQHQWNIAASGTAGNAITFTQAMTLDASGNLQLGTTTAKTTVWSGSGNGLTIGGAIAPGLAVYDTTDTSYVGYIYQANADTSVGNNANGNLTFATNNTERARIDSSGNLLVGTTSQAGRFTINGSTADNTANAISIRDSAASTLFVVRNDGRIGTGGSLSPYNNTTASAANQYVDSAGVFYRSTSSLKYKTNVQDAVHGLAELLTLRPVTYEGLSEADAGKTFGGLIAEEVHASGLTEFVQYAEDETPDALAYGNMVSLCIKAIQEQQAIITQLQADVAALKGQA